jgi:hypothetical protein
MGVADFLLFPFYLLLFYIFFKSRSNHLQDPILKIYHQRGFWIKALTVIAFALFNAKISPGDSYLLYHTEGANIYKLVLNDFSNLRWITSPGMEYDQSGLLADTLECRLLSGCQ